MQVSPGTQLSSLTTESVCERMKHIDGIDRSTNKLPNQPKKQPANQPVNKQLTSQPNNQLVNPTN